MQGDGILTADAFGSNDGVNSRIAAGLNTAGSPSTGVALPAVVVSARYMTSAARSVVPILRGVNEGALAAWDVNDFLTAAAVPRLAGVKDGDSTFNDFLDLVLVSLVFHG